jgi:hypothetical protein
LASVGLPVIHLHTLFYLLGWVPSERSVFQERVNSAIAGDRWVTDGNFITDTGAMRLTRADTISGSISHCSSASPERFRVFLSTARGRSSQQAAKTD